MQTEASLRQVQAAEPTVSTWLSANAGSGKTRVLTDRVARLLLGGCAPQRILCLTYTKAAAAEMQNRLFQRLGEWAMLPDVALRAALANLGIVGEVDPALLAQARRLFARAIETPGGLRIQTIHSFCAALLRRFPLEAGVSPRFTELDDRSGEVLRAAIVEEMAETLAPDVIAALAGEYTGESLSKLVDEVARSREAFSTLYTPEMIQAAFGLAPGDSICALLAEVFCDDEAAYLPRIAAVMTKGKPTDVKGAATLATLRLTPPDAGTLEALEGVLLFGSGAKAFEAKSGSFPTKDTRPLLGDDLAALEALMGRVEAARPRRLALAAAARTGVLHDFAGLFLPEYAARKAARGWLDFDDLILRARALLTNPSVAQWVLYRLDGGIDHILVDEAQDTGPAQWEVIAALARELLPDGSGDNTARTIFVVGDKKQSIYSFQGADLRAFDAMQGAFSEQLAVGPGLRRLELEYSFRSAPAILRAVDLTFDERAGRDLGGAVKHLAFHDAMPGRVDLWPAIPPQDGEEPGNWFDPVDQPGSHSPQVQLARTIALEIKRMLDEGVQIWHGKAYRPLRAGDFLILVQRRSELFAEVIRACKAADLPIAGADRLKLGAELAVRDLAALLSFLATPEDDLSLAATLRSPLFGWSEGALYDLAQPRRGYLWAALREAAAAHEWTHAILSDLRDKADFLRPYEIIERMLTRHDGRRRLIARLGPEAEDGIDQLLSQALAYERLGVPSLTGFLAWLETDDVEVKRRVDAASNRIRVMTVHGAKGLEAPVVILPDTVDRRTPSGGDVIRLASGLPVWRPAAADMPPAATEAKEAIAAAQAEENLRLLYVAMTRAETWLIVAGAGTLKSGDAWHDLVRAGLEAAGAVDAAFPTGAGLRLESGDWAGAGPAVQTDAPPPAALPAWAATDAPTLPRPERPLSPSDLGGAKALPGEGQAEDEAKRRGVVLHALLEHLPLHPSAAWRAIAARITGGRDTDLVGVAARVLSTPDLAPVFAPEALAEVPVVATFRGRQVYGMVDRLIVAPDRVLAVDFKSNTVVPAGPAEVPEGLLRQMALYADALRQVYPDRAVEVAILWTTTAHLMPLPDATLRAARDRVTSP